MNQLNQAVKTAPAQRGQAKPVAVLNAETARAIYLQSSNRLDLKTLIEHFKSAPDSVECSGKIAT